MSVANKYFDVLQKLTNIYHSKCNDFIQNMADTYIPTSLVIILADNINLFGKHNRNQLRDIYQLPYVQLQRFWIIQSKGMGTFLDKLEC